MERKETCGELLLAWGGVHPNVFLRETPPEGSGLFCLYVSADMTEEGGVGEGACGELAEDFGALHSYRERRGFCLLLQRQGREEELFCKALATAMEDWGLTGGLAGPFASANLALGCLEKAREAALTEGLPKDASPLRRLPQLRWQLFCRRAARSVAREGYTAEDFLQHSLRRILRYDEENGSAYYPSMYEYLLRGKNLKLAAEKLGVHRNTLAYRIGRIGELFAIDFEDRQICFEMLFACKLYECALEGTPNGALSPPQAGESIREALWRGLYGGNPPELSLSSSQSAPSLEGGAYRMYYADTTALDEGKWDAFLKSLGEKTPLPMLDYAFDEDGLAALYPGEGEGLSQALMEVTHRFGVEAALSQPFDRARLARQPGLLKLTIRAGRRLYPEQSYFRFQSYASLAFFLLAQRHMRPATYHSEEVLQIIHYDYERGTELSRSLYLYLFYFMDLKAAARDAQMHRNTLDYQIKRVGQILGALPGTEQRFEMMCTYSMLAMEEE